VSTFLDLGPMSHGRPRAYWLAQAELRQHLVFVEGNESDFEHTKSIFQAIGSSAHYLGPIRCGLVLRLAANDSLAVQVVVAERPFSSSADHAGDGRDGRGNVGRVSAEGGRYRNGSPTQSRIA
jgi:hypothetical protein